MWLCLAAHMVAPSGWLSPTNGDASACQSCSLGGAASRRRCTLGNAALRGTAHGDSTHDDATVTPCGAVLSNAAHFVILPTWQSWILGVAPYLGVAAQSVTLLSWLRHTNVSNEDLKHGIAHLHGKAHEHGRVRNDGGQSPRMANHTNESAKQMQAPHKQHVTLSATPKYSATRLAVSHDRPRRTTVNP